MTSSQLLMRSCAWHFSRVLLPRYQVHDLCAFHVSRMLHAASSTDSLSISICQSKQTDPDSGALIFLGAFRMEIARFEVGTTFASNSPRTPPELAQTRPRPGGSPTAAARTQCASRAARDRRPGKPPHRDPPPQGPPGSPPFARSRALACGIM